MIDKEKGVPTERTDRAGEERGNWRQKVEAAHEMISALCRPRGSAGSREWVMSIPANREHDPDLVIADGLRAAERRIKELESSLRARTHTQPRVTFDCTPQELWKAWYSSANGGAISVPFIMDYLASRARVSVPDGVPSADPAPAADSLAELCYRTYTEYVAPDEITDWANADPWEKHAWKLVADALRRTRKPSQGLIDQETRSAELLRPLVRTECADGNHEIHHEGSDEYLCLVKDWREAAYICAAYNALLLRLAGAEKDRDVLLAKQGAMEKQCNILNLENVRLERERQEQQAPVLWDDVKRLTAERDEYKATAIELQEEVKKAEADRGELPVKVQRLECELALSRNGGKAQRKVLLALSKEHDVLKDKLALLNVDRDELEASVQRLTAERDELRAKLAEAEKDVNDMRDERDVEHQKYEDLLKGYVDLANKKQPAPAPIAAAETLEQLEKIWHKAYNDEHYKACREKEGTAPLPHKEVVRRSRIAAVTAILRAAWAYVDVAEEELVGAIANDIRTGTSPAAIAKTVLPWFNSRIRYRVELPVEAPESPPDDTKPAPDLRQRQRECYERVYAANVGDKQGIVAHEYAVRAAVSLPVRLAELNAELDAALKGGAG